MIKLKKIEPASEIPEEPEASDPTAVRIIIMLPGGQVGDFSLIFPHCEHSDGSGA